MKLARLDNTGVIVELFEKEGIEKRLHADLIQKLVEVSDRCEIGMYMVGGKVIEKQPSPEHELVNGKWVLDEEPKNRNEKINEAFKRLVALDVSEIKDPILRDVVSVLTRGR